MDVTFGVDRYFRTLSLMLRSGFYVGVGGSSRPNSSSEVALDIAMRRISAEGHTTRSFTGEQLASLPLYAPTATSALGAELTEAVRQCDGLVIATPGYHGTISGMVKNALDYLEVLREDVRCYLEGRPVGCIAVASGWDAAVGSLLALRGIVHSLRGWPTSYGAAINALETDVREDPNVAGSLARVASQVMWFSERAVNDLETDVSL